MNAAAVCVSLHRAAYAEIHAVMRAELVRTWEASGARRRLAREAYDARIDDIIWHNRNDRFDDEDDLPIARGFWSGGQTSAGRG